MCAPLVGRLPWERRQALRAELAAHLDCLAAAELECGCSPDEAVPRALRHFGDPSRLGRQYAAECPPGEGAFRKSAFVALGCFAAASILLGASMAVGPRVEWGLQQSGALPGSFLPLLQVWCVFLLPFLAGGIAGYLNRRRGPGVVLLAMAGTGLAWFLLGVFTSAAGWPENPFGALGGFQLAAWLPGSVAGWFSGSRLRRWREDLPAQWRPG